MDRLQFCAWLLAGPLLVARPSSGHAKAAPAAPMAPASAVDVAGRLRMLSQRMVKAYLMLGQGIAADDARIILQGSITQFESQLAALQVFQPTATVRGALAKLEGAWKKCKPLLRAAPGQAGGVELYDASEALQQAAHSLTLAYEQVTGSPIDHLISIAGRQRMLSQRMAKFYFYRTWGLFDAPADMELHLSRAHFTAVLVQIESSQLATAQVKAGVARIRREWEPYQLTLFASNVPATMRRDAPQVAALSERVLVVTEELVGQLVAQAQGAAR
ncbi:type IV pili methyl-accepting chemotaxis transducer N-terminal domain-containing protein [Rhodoferax sp.]|uniref:type IV pili methyl-accepting chemotaxis transducer N-terminal domain-containing protein n=1 Tax=Rhodoferax sp. TaxID=50421 RepID=UPI0027516ABA|nr:type IV pili methyl-accepting chemotaxis transducer N-terminal domain-containing protein [Rhodoferax sp.]